MHLCDALNGTLMVRLDGWTVGLLDREIAQALSYIFVNPAERGSVSVLSIRIILSCLVCHAVAAVVDCLKQQTYSLERQQLGF